MDICDLGKGNQVEYFGSIVYFVLMIEYTALLIALIVLWKRSYRNSLYNLIEYRNYIYMISASSLLKIVMFFDSCVAFGEVTMILIVAYELPYISSETLVIYLWRVMQMDAISKIEGKDLNKQQKLEFYLIFSFNVLLYLFLIVLIIFVVASEHNQFWLISRSFKASIEVASGLGIVISGVKLLLTIKRMMGSVPKNLLFWITIGAITSIIKSGEQIFFYFSDQDDTFQLFNMIILFISYHLTDLIPTLVFLHSFKVYSRFLRQNRESIDSFDEIISEKLQTFDLD